MALISPACYAQPMYVEAPATGKATPFGLFSVADIIEGGDVHWQTGVEYEPHRAGAASVYACPTCAQVAAGTVPAKIYTSGVPLVNSTPFTIYSSFACSPFGHWDDALDRARIHLMNGEERAVENEVALGNFHSTVNLTSATSVDITPTPGTPVTVAQGLALLEQYAASNQNGEGYVIMGARRDISLLNTNGPLILCPNSPTLHTSLGTPVAALSGFNGRTGPNDVAAAAGNAWLFATGTPRIQRSEIFMVPPDREHAMLTNSAANQNNLRALAERTYSVSWSAFTAGVLVTSIGSA